MTTPSLSNKLENRKYIRIPGRLILRCRPYRAGVLKEKPGAEMIPCTTKNISGGGLLFESDRKYDLGTLLKMELRFPGWQKYKTGFYWSDTSFSDQLVVLARVVRVEEIRINKIYDIGVMFCAVDRDHHAAFLKAIEQKRLRMSP